MLREHNERIQLAWHTANLVRAKRIPEVARLMARDVEQRPVQSPDEQWAILMSMGRSVPG